MARIFAWCDSPTAPTGFGRSVQHVLGALHAAGHEIVQLAVNLDLGTVGNIPWRVFAPTDRANDPYGVNDLAQVVMREAPFDVVWTTFDPEVPWKYGIPGTNPQVDALNFLQALRGESNGCKFAGWFPVDGGPLSNYELGVLGLSPAFDLVATMSPHVHDLMEWTLKLRGGQADRKQIESRIQVCPHGVDLDRYRIPTPEEKRQARAALGIPIDALVVLQVERNQQRKQNYLGLEVAERLLRRRPEWRGRLVLYQHMQPDEENTGCRVGFNLPELAWRYGLRAGQDVMWPRGFVSEADMVQHVYACADAFLSTSTGEGFQYPAWEALACGLPIVVPRDSARAAWFPSCPNAHLYKTEDRALVMRGGYNRRMGMPSAEAAAAVLPPILEGKTPRSAEPGRAWVGRTAELKQVQAWWVERIAKLAEDLVAERKKARIAVAGTVPTALVTMEHAPGLGDLVMAAPALRALRGAVSHMRLRVPRTHLDLARLLDVAHDYATRPAPGDEGASIVAHLHELYWPEDTGGWGDPRRHRAEVVADFLDARARMDGYVRANLATTSVDCGEEIRGPVRAKFLEAFGLSPTECIGVALQSGSPHRALPDGYAMPLCAAIKSMGAVPVLLGGRALGVRTHGVLDLTGQTDLRFLVGLLDLLGAVVTTDSSTFHLAAMQGTPTVCAFTLVEPEARAKYYGARIRSITPSESEVDGEQWPAGHKPKARPGAWPATIKLDSLLAALRELTGIGDGGPRILRPTDAQVAAVR